MNPCMSRLIVLTAVFALGAIACGNEANSPGTIDDEMSAEEVEQQLQTLNAA
jgi:hypothetical protein